MAYEDFKSLTRKTASDKISCDQALNIAKNPKFGGYQRGCASIVYKFSDKETSGSGIKNESIGKKELAENYANQLLKNLKKEKYTQLL